MKKLIYLIFALVVFASCEEDYDNPIEGLETTNLFVQLGANTPDSVSLTEGEMTQSLTIQAPISANQNLLASLTFEGSAVYGTDFIIETPDGDFLVSADADGAVIRVPFLPAKPNEFVTDQVSFIISFAENFIQDGDKDLTVTLTGATGEENSGVTLDGGRGSIRRQFYIEIADNDCGNLAGLYDVEGDVLVSDLGPLTYNYDEALGLADCTQEGIYPVVDITGGLWSDGYANLYGTSAINALITINSTNNEVTWGTVSDQFGGAIIQDPVQPVSNYDPSSNTVTIYWTATAYNERGVTTYTLQ
ncbi:hypothetical protein QYS49_34025 [Marivirga salinae]|uniref:Uncharacterized protein n=1 Tax=Marivirga salinarum TaxID=3059078 RepID=A0AA51RBS4_9BACT|nr:hypothetical protein [Marivirga sp. BDSF4-3]WMN12601.1 hypothetical protein QYS49_34025 [Marivirga sp. BDSF4-3]